MSRIAHRVSFSAVLAVALASSVWATEIVWLSSLDLTKATQGWGQAPTCLAGNS